MQVQLVAQSQYPSLVDLLCELYAYYNDGAQVARELVRAHLLENLLAEGSPLRLAVASFDDGQVAGLAAVHLTHSLVEPAPERRRQCQLKELYVRKGRRSRGVGRALMAWVARYAVENGCCRIDWSVKASNTRGMAFYESVGAELVAERLSYRLSGLRLRELASVNVPCRTSGA